MKTRLFLFLFMIFSLTMPITSYAQKPINCNFGDDSTSLDDIFQKDIAAKTFLNKYPDALRSVVIQSHDPMQGELSFTIDENDKKEILLLKFNQNENGCYRPYAYHYTFSDGINDVTVKNTILDFTEIINLIKSDNKRIEDFYTKNCNQIQLTAVLEGESKPYFCKSDVSGSIEMYLQKYVGGIIEIHIPDKVMDALFYNCAPNEGFFVLSSGEEIDYDLIAENNTTIIKIDVPIGYNKIEIFQSYNIGGFDGFCGSIWSDNSRYISPLLQTKIGVDSWNVKCNEDLELVLKNNNNPACVLSESIPKLIQRNWMEIENVTSESSRLCYSIPDGGLCKAAIEKYYFDWKSNSCKSFTWGGCGGTVPFDTMKLCQNLCN